MAHVIFMTQFNGRRDVILCGKVESSLFKAPCGLWRTGSYRDVIATNFSKLSLNQSWQCRLQISEEHHLQARVGSEWNRLEGLYLLTPVTGLYDKVFLFTLDLGFHCKIDFLLHFPLHLDSINPSFSPIYLLSQNTICIFTPPVFTLYVILSTFQTHTHTHTRIRSVLQIIN